MNYKHIYHAGSFTDVFKHVMLVALLNSFKQKATPFCYLDTHGGAGYYDLFSTFANKTKEYTSGIEKIIQKENPPDVIKEYLSCIHQINDKLSHTKFSSLRYYPGSPLLARLLLRPKDRIVACELQSDEYEALRKTFVGDKQVSLHHMDGFLGLKAFLPPAERRGLILIDPPYEDPDEFTRIAHSLPMALKRFETGVYAIWYPIKEKKSVERFHHALKGAIAQPVLLVELTTYPDLPQHLNGSGLAIINPPWQFDTTVQNVLPWLWKSLTINDQGDFQAYLLK